MMVSRKLAMTKLTLASMAIRCSRAFALSFDPSQQRGGDGKWSSGGGPAPKTSTGKAKGSLRRRVKVKVRRKAIAKPKAEYQKAKAAAAANPADTKAQGKLAKAADRLKQARADAARKHSGANPDGLQVKRSGTAEERRAALQPAKSEYQKAKSEHLAHGNKETASRLEVAHARLVEARSGAKSVDSSTWGERANFDDVLKAKPTQRHSESHANEVQSVEQLMHRHVDNGDPAGARKVAREHVRHRTSTQHLAGQLASGMSKSDVRDEVDAELSDLKDRLHTAHRGPSPSHASKTMANHEHRLAKAEAYARLEAAHQVTKSPRKRNA